MKLHANARTCPKSRALIARRVLEERWSLAAAAEAAGVSVVTARKWVRRAAAGESLEDRSSAPKRVPSRTPPGLVEAGPGEFDGLFDVVVRAWLVSLHGV